MWGSCPLLWLHPDDGAGRGAELKQDGMPALLSGTPGVPVLFYIRELVYDNF